jgi:hypothetical protein
MSGKKYKMKRWRLIKEFALKIKQNNEFKSMQEIYFSFREKHKEHQWTKYMGISTFSRLLSKTANRIQLNRYRDNKDNLYFGQVSPMGFRQITKRRALDE